MNAHPAPIELEQHELDLLVEGELPLAQRRALIARLDEIAGGWRRCALAFMEAQAWRSSMRAMVDAPAAPITSLATSLATSASRSASLATFAASSNGRSDAACDGAMRDVVSEAKAAPTAASATRGDEPRCAGPHAEAPTAGKFRFTAAALSLLVALTIGYLAGSTYSSGSAQLSGGGSEAQNANSPTDPDRTPREDEGPQGVERNDAEGNNTPQNLANDDGPPLRFVGTVEFDGTDSPLPVVSGPGLDEEWLRSQPPLLSDYERSVLAQRGWQVREDRHVITVKLNDGSKLAIPMDSLSYKYVGGRVH